MTRLAAVGTLLVLAVTGTAQAQTKPAAAPAAAAAEKPQYGGALSVANVYYTISPLTFDSADMAWKFNQDTGLV